MKIAITGGNGFIGRRLVSVLSSEGHDVSVLSRRANGTFPEGVQIVRGDLTSEDCPLNRLLEGCEIIFHCAGEVQNVAAMKLLHVDGTRRLLKATRNEAEKGGRVIHWVQLSSVGAYGRPNSAANAERVVNEDTQTMPIGEYEVTKTLSDELVIQACESGLITYSIVRPSNVFAANMSKQFVRSMGEMVRKRLFFYIGRPGAVATYVHVDDVVEVLRLCGVDSRAKGKVFNISNDCLLEEMVEGIASALAVNPPRLRLPEFFVRFATYFLGRIVHLPLTQVRIDSLVARTKYPYLKLKRELGFIPRIPVPSAIGEVVSEK